jgi:hypothetical protein
MFSGITFGDPFWRTNKAKINPDGSVYFPSTPFKSKLLTESL